MLFGMLAQIVCGNVTGMVKHYALHVFFRCLSAVCCAQMYTAGQMICKYIVIAIGHIWTDQKAYSGDYLSR